VIVAQYYEIQQNSASDVMQTKPQYKKAVKNQINVFNAGFKHKQPQNNISNFRKGVTSTALD
jgi:hypothetical protein